jgi:hypothetical protein
VTHDGILSIFYVDDIVVAYKKDREPVQLIRIDEACAVHWIEARRDPLDSCFVDASPVLRNRYVESWS